MGTRACGCGEGQGSAAVRASPRLCGIHGDAMPGGGSSGSDDPERCSKA